MFGWGDIISGGLKAYNVTAQIVSQVLGLKHDANEKQSGIDAAVSKGQADVITGVQDAQRAQAAGTATAGDPAGQWAAGVHDKYQRPD